MKRNYMISAHFRSSAHFFLAHTPSFWHLYNRLQHIKTNCSSLLNVVKIYFWPRCIMKVSAFPLQKLITEKPHRSTSIFTKPQGFKYLFTIVCHILLTYWGNRRGWNWRHLLSFNIFHLFILITKIYFSNQLFIF